MQFTIKKSVLKGIFKSLNKSKLEDLKAEVISILERKEKQDLKKAIEYFDSQESKNSCLVKSLEGKWIEKSGYGLGTVRIWKGKKYKKVSANPTRWVRVYDKMDRGAKGSFTKLINKVHSCQTVEDLYKFCTSYHSLFQDDNGVDLPIMDKLRAAIDAKKNSVGDELNGSTHFDTEHIVKRENLGKILREEEKNKKNKEAMKHTGEIKSDKNDSGSYDDKKAFKEYHDLIMKDNPSKEDDKRIGELIQEHYKHSDETWPGGAALKGDDSKVLSNGKTIKEVREKYGIKVDSDKDSNEEKTGPKDNRTGGQKMTDAELEKMDFTQLRKIQKDYFDKIRAGKETTEEEDKLNIKASKQESILEAKTQINHEMSHMVDLKTVEDKKNYIDDLAKRTEDALKKANKSKERMTNLRKKNEMVDKIHALEDTKEALRQISNDLYEEKDTESKLSKDEIKTEPEESEAEKHQNRSDAMKGNKNAYKGKAELEKMSLKELEDYKDELFKKYTHIDFKKKNELGDAREAYREALDTWQERIQKEADVKSEFKTRLLNKLIDTMNEKPLWVEKWNLKEMSDGNLKRYIEGAEKWKDKGIVHLANPIIEKFENSNKEMFDNNDFVGPALDRDFYAISHSSALENMKKELESRNQKKEEPKKEETKPAAKEEKEVKTSPAEKGNFSPSTKGDPDDMKPVAPNEKIGDNKVKMPYSKELSYEIKQLINSVGNERYSRSFLNKVYYQDGNLISTDTRRLKIVKVGKLDGIPDNSYVNIQNGKDGVTIEADEEFTKNNKFPNYKMIVPKENNQKITLDNKALKSKINELKNEGGWNTKDPKLTFEIKDGALMLDGVRVGDANGVKFKEDEDKKDWFNVNAEYLLNALANGDTSYLMISENSLKAFTLNTGSSSSIIMPLAKESHKYDSSGKEYKELEKKDYNGLKESKKAADDQKAKIKQIRQETLNSFVEECVKQFSDESVQRLIDSVNNKNLKDHKAVIENSYKSYKAAEKMLENPTSKCGDSLSSNKYGYRLVAVARKNPDFKTALENMAKEYGFELKKSLLDFLDFDIDDDSEDEETGLENNYLDSDYDASQPELFNNTACKVGNVLDSYFD